MPTPTPDLERRVIVKENGSMRSRTSLSLGSRTLHVAAVLAILASLLAALVAVHTGTSAAPDQRSASLAARQQAAGTEYPLSLTLQGQQFLFDRLVPLDRNTLERIADRDDLAIYARTETGPFDAIYGLLSGRSKLGLARYLPTNADAPDTTCAAEVAQVGALNVGETTYAFAGIETDITVDTLQQVATLEDQSVYSDPDTAQPYPELFVDSDQGLIRY